jgi:hypothetical protein
MNPTGPTKHSQDAPIRPRRSKPLKPPVARSTVEGRRRPATAQGGKEFVYASKGSSRTGDTQTNQTPNKRVDPAGITSRHLGKVRPGAQRKRNVRMRKLWQSAVIVVALVIVVYGTYFCFTSPQFTITNVAVNGLSAEDGQALQTYVSQDAIGANVFTYWLTKHRKVSSRVLSSDSDLESAAIRIHLPSTIDLNLVERKPDLLIAFGKNGSMGAWMMDSTGLPIRNQLSPRWNERPPNLLKVIVDPRRVSPVDLASIQLGQPLPADIGVIVSDLHSLRDSLELSSLYPQVESIRIDNSGYLGLNMRSHLLIKLGDISSLDRKIALASALVSQRSDIVEGDRYIDVTDPDWPAVMPLAKSAVSVVPSTPVSPALGTKFESQSQSVMP